MRIINMTKYTTWVDYQGGVWERPSVYRTEGNHVVDTRCNRREEVNRFLRQAPNVIVVVTREVAATIDQDLLDRVRVPGVAAMIGGGFYAEPFNPHAQ